METFVLIIRERFPSLRLHLHVMVTDCCGTKKSWSEEMQPNLSMSHNDELQTFDWKNMGQIFEQEFESTWH